METISQSLLTFVLNAAWQITLIAAIAGLCTYLMRRGPASHRHAVWFAALIGAVLLPALSVTNTRRVQPLTFNLSMDTPAFPVTSPVRTNVANVAPRTPRLPETVPFSQRAAIVVIAAYAALVLFACIRFCRALLKTVEIRRTATGKAATPMLRRVWDRCSGLFGTAELLSSQTIISPVAVGLLNPAVIVPDSLWNEDSEEVLTAAIGHELVHVSRRDYMLNLLQEILLIPIAFHPAVWFIKRNLERTREMACDEAVTAGLLERRVYAQSIMRIAKAVSGLPRPGYSLGIFDGNILEQRIRLLLERTGVDRRRARVFLATALTTLAICTIGAAGFALTARAQSPYQDQMKAGGEAYNAGNFNGAIEHFSAAVKVDPENINAKLFLANALMRQYYSESNPSAQLIENARQQYQDVLARDPRNKQANAGVLSLLIDQKDMNAAREWALKLSSIDANDPNVWYTLGLLDWAIAFPDFQKAKQASGAKQEDYRILDPALRKKVRDEHLAQVEDGFRMLNRALLLNAENDQAMAYMNLLYRLKAGLVDDQAEAAELISMADMWVTKALQAKRANSNSNKTTTAAINVDGPPPGPAGRNTMVKAPPPPPPPPPPRDRSQQIASAAPPPRPTPGELPSVGQYWQVMGTTDMPAIDLFRQLKSHGFDAAMHAGPDGATRVVVGPFFDNVSRDRTKAALEKTGFRPIRHWE